MANITMPNKIAITTSSLSKLSLNRLCIVGSVVNLATPKIISIV